MENLWSIQLIRGIAMRRRPKIILAVIGMMLVRPYVQIGLIAAQAQYYANGRPYCSEVSGSQFRQYRTVCQHRLRRKRDQRSRLDYVGAGRHGNAAALAYPGMTT